MSGTMLAASVQLTEDEGNSRVSSEFPKGCLARVGRPHRLRLADRPRDLPRTPLLQVDATKKIASAPSPSSRPTWVPRLGSMIVPIRCDASGFSEREAAWAMSRNRWREWMRRRPPLRFRALGRPGKYPGRKTTPCRGPNAAERYAGLSIRDVGDLRRGRSLEALDPSFDKEFAPRGRFCEWRVRRSEASLE